MGLIFEAFVERRGSRSGPIFKTGDRRTASDLARMVETAIEYSHGEGEVVMLMVTDGCIENDTPDWRHPDFLRSNVSIPTM